MSETQATPVLDPALPGPAEDESVSPGEREYRAFLRLLPGLLATHRGLYVAVHGGRVIDVGPDDIALVRRAHAAVGYVPIHVGLVTDRPPVVRNPPLPRVPPAGRRMIRYRYAALRTPPAPFVNVAVANPATGARSAAAGAQIDTAADRTVLPGAMVESLGLVEDGRLLFQGFAGDVVELPVFLVAVHVHDFPPVLVRAALGEAEPHVLLGRDVLNAFRLVLDGPGGYLEIGPPDAV